MASLILAIIGIVVTMLLLLSIGTAHIRIEKLEKKLNRQIYGNSHIPRMVRKAEMDERMN